MLHKVSYSLREYLNYLSKMHYSELDDSWGFYIDIEKYKQSPFIFKRTISIPIRDARNEFSRILTSEDNIKKIKSRRSVTNLNESTDSLIFKMDEDYKTQEKNHKKLNIITNLCVISSIVLFLIII